MYPPCPPPPSKQKRKKRNILQETPVKKRKSLVIWNRNLSLISFFVLSFFFSSKFVPNFQHFTHDNKRKHLHMTPHMYWARHTETQNQGRPSLSYRVDRGRPSLSYRVNQGHPSLSYRVKKSCPESSRSEILTIQDPLEALHRMDDVWTENTFSQLFQSDS
jgi:hypothetical protein